MLIVGVRGRDIAVTGVNIVYTRSTQE